MWYMSDIDEQKNDLKYHDCELFDKLHQRPYSQASLQHR